MSPAKRRATSGRGARRPAKKRAAARPAKKRAAARPAKKRAAARPARKRAAARPARKRAAARPARKRAAARPARERAVKRTAKRPARGLKLVRRPLPRAKRKPAPAVPPPAFPQRGAASPKQLVLFELVRSWARVLAAIQGLSAGSAGRSVGAGTWTVRETVLHLHAWDLEWERALEPACRGTRPAWLDHGPEELARLNQALLEPLGRLPWDEAVRRLHAGRARLLEAIESLPEEPAAMWTREHPLGELLAVLPEHDHHHAEVIKRARAEAPPPPRTP
jgi:uncharacterized damage-inducible protein DinB